MTPAEVCVCSRGEMGGREERRRQQGMAVGVGEKNEKREKGGKEERVGEESLKKGYIHT